jgi:hypothetical protein
MPRGRKLTEFSQPMIDVPLNADDQARKARELAELCGDIDKDRADAAEAASSARKRIRAMEKRRRVLADCVRTGVEKRPAQMELGEKPNLAVVGGKKKGHTNGADA